MCCAASCASSPTRTSSSSSLSYVTLSSASTMSPWPWRSFSSIYARSRSQQPCWCAALYTPSDALHDYELLISRPFADILALPNISTRPILYSTGQCLQDMPESVQQGAAYCLWRLRQCKEREDYGERFAGDCPWELRSRQYRRPVSPPLGWPAGRRASQKAPPSSHRTCVGRYSRQRRPTCSRAYRHCWYNKIETGKGGPPDKLIGPSAPEQQQQQPGGASPQAQDQGTSV